MVLISIMLWSAIFAQAVRAMAVGRADQSFDQSLLAIKQPISNIIRPYDSVPHRYMVKLKDNVSDIDTHNHRESVAARQVKLASQLHPAHSFFEATAAEPQKYGGITDCLNATMNGYIGYFTDDMIDEISKSDLVDFIHQDGYEKSNGVISNRETTEIPQRSLNRFWIEMTQPDVDWHLRRIATRQFSKDKRASFKFMEDSGAGVDIYVIDSGVWNKHEEFRVVISGPDVGFDNLEDTTGHGTCVASLAAGMYSGVAKRSVIYSSRVTPPGKGAGTTLTMASVVDKIVNIHMRRRLDASYQGTVINISMGSYANERRNENLLQNAIDKAVEQGIHVVVSAGNQNDDACLYNSARNPYAITVGASTLDDRKAYFSNFGECVDVYAPGDYVGCASNETHNGIVYKSGTSMAAPVVAGIVAGILSYAPHSGTKYSKGTQISPADMKTLIKRIATPEAKNQLLSTEAIAYFGGTKEELDFFYHLLVNDPTGTKIQTPQFAVPPPSLKASREILTEEEKLYKYYFEELREDIIKKSKEKGVEVVAAN